MATPLSADRLLAALRGEGVMVTEVRDWRTHNRNHKGAWGPVHGVMIHHTVTKGTDDSVALCYNGRSDLPGPLCHGVIAKNGTVYMVGNGRANHAGLGDDDVLRAVINQAPLPADNEANTDGNARFYGFECINMGDGKDPWPEAQLLAIEKVSAAICRAHGWNTDSVIGHLEWQPGKVDPRGFTMASMRARVEKRLGAQPAPAAPPKPPTTTKPKIDLSHVVAAAKRDPNLRQGGTTYKAEVLRVERALHAEGLLAKQWIDGSFGTRTKTAYAAWQVKCGYHGSAADGIPGKTSLTKLGKKHGFIVVD